MMTSLGYFSIKLERKRERRMGSVCELHCVNMFVINILVKFCANSVLRDADTSKDKCIEQENSGSGSCT